MVVNWFARVLLLLGLILALAATPDLIEPGDANDTACKTSGSTDGQGNLSCNIDLPCTGTGETCQPTKWHKKIYDPYIKYCSCTLHDTYVGPDPTTGLCMAYIVESGSPPRWISRCSSGNCNSTETCRRQASDGRCTCQSP
jgi:hypothetical protein